MESKVHTLEAARTGHRTLKAKLIDLAGLPTTNQAGYQIRLIVVTGTYINTALQIVDAIPFPKRNLRLSEP